MIEFLDSLRIRERAKIFANIEKLVELKKQRDTLKARLRRKNLLGKHGEVENDYCRKVFERATLF